jgi:hypothetical protein
MSQCAGMSPDAPFDASIPRVIIRSMRRMIVIGLLVPVCVAAGAARGAHAVLPSCHTSQFTVRFGPLVSEATGQHAITLRLINRGRRACVVVGYPKISVYDRAGPIPFAITHDGDQMVTARRPKPIIVRHGRAAFVVLNHYRCDRGDVRTAAILRIGIGRVTQSGMATIQMTDPDRRLDYCGRGDPGSTLAVSPFVPTLRAGLRP